MKVSAILKGKPDQFGRYPVVIRINQGEKRTYHVTPYRAATGDFTGGKFINDETTNDRIRQLAIRYETELLSQKRKYPDALFFTYVEKCLKEWSNVRAYNTMRNYKVEAEKLKEFLSTFKLSEVTPEFLSDYSNFLYDKKKNIATTVWTSLKFVRTIILKALREKVIEDNPFVIFKMPAYKDPQVNYLTKAEISKIEKYIPKAGPNRFCATWFVIGCYTGLRYSDMNAFSKEKNIRSGRLIVHTMKTKEIVSMPISPKLKKLFSSIAYQSMFISNQKYNSALKKIGEKLKLPELSSHQARHTFAVLCAESGISQEVTAKLLGHKKLSSTAVYYKITNRRLDRELTKIF